MFFQSHEWIEIISQVKSKKVQPQSVYRLNRKENNKSPFFTFLLRFGKNTDYAKLEQKYNPKYCEIKVGNNIIQFKIKWTMTGGKHKRIKEYLMLNIWD